MTTHEFRNCRYCAGEIDELRLRGHEQECRARTPQERQRLTQARAYHHKQHHLRIPARSVRANGHNKRLSATISVDFKSFRELLLQLAPLLSIDKVEVL